MTVWRSQDVQQPWHANTAQQKNQRVVGVEQLEAVDCSLIIIIIIIIIININIYLKINIHINNNNNNIIIIIVIIVVVINNNNHYNNNNLFIYHLFRTQSTSTEQIKRENEPQLNKTSD